MSLNSITLRIMQLLFHLRIEDLVLKVVAGPFEAGKVEERAVRDVLWGRGNNVVRDVWV